MAFDYRARKFNRAKWEKPPFIKDDDIPADALICLRTADNKLSFWECSNQNDSVEDVVLALATGSKIKYLEKMHVIVLPIESLDSAHFPVDRKEGDTHVEDLKLRHVDLIELTLSKLTVLAKLMAAQMRDDVGCYSFTKKQVADILNNSISKRRITIDRLSPEISGELERLRS
jgi:hypothetical protein